VLADSPSTARGRSGSGDPQGCVGYPEVPSFGFIVTRGFDEAVGVVPFETIVG
jgi:hypothetical protein